MRSLFTVQRTLYLLFASGIAGLCALHTIFWQTYRKEQCGMRVLCVFAAPVEVLHHYSRTCCFSCACAATVKGGLRRVCGCVCYEVTTFGSHSFEQQSYPKSAEF